MGQERLLFTRKGASRLMAGKASLLDKLKAVQKQKGEVAGSGGDSWHDNFSFEELCRQEQMVNYQIREVNDEISRMTVIDGNPPDCEKLRIGLVAHLLVDDKLMTVLVGGHGDSDQNANPPVLSYNAPLIRDFLGKEPGFETTLNIAGKKQIVVLKRITKPQGG